MSNFTVSESPTLQTIMHLIFLPVSGIQIGCAVHSPKKIRIHKFAFILFHMSNIYNIYISMEMKNNTSVYSLQLSGINCTNCQGKILKNLTEKVSSTQLVKVSVNILQQKVSLVVANDQGLKSSIGVLQELGYRIIGDPTLIKSGNESTRSVSFIYEINAKSEELENAIKKLTGVVSVYRVHLGASIKLTVSYDCNMIKGRQIADVIEACDPNFQTINHRVQSFKTVKPASTSSSIKTTAILCLFFLIFDMILPLTGQWYMEVLMFPMAMTKYGPFTLSVIINLILTLYVLNTYAKPFILRSFHNYAQNGSMDMETLISLGCISAFSLFLFFVFKDIFGLYFNSEEMGNKFSITGHEIMEINDALASSSIIVLVVTIGKHFQRQVKEKIEKMTEQIFPDSKLFENMTIDYIKLKNRKLTIAEQKKYDVTLLEKDDVFQIQSGRLLVDSIVLAGEFEAIKSAIDGNDEVENFVKGDRIESGSVVISSINGFLQVENVFEKSVLIQIGTHIKLRENEKENNESGIQAVCKTVSKYFVKTVILISLLVMAIWFFLLSFNYVTVPGCSFCWIIERGIGVLVASCPCALGLAVPSVVAIVLNIAIQNGILIRNTSVMEKMKKCKIISFDKTGTLFTRINEIEQYYKFSDELPEETLWEIIAVVEKQLRHPIAEILYKEAYQRCGVDGTNFSVLLNKPAVITKQGLTSEVLLKKSQQVSTIFLGNRNILQENGIAIPEFNKKGKGATVLYLAIDHKAFMVMVINTHSNLRPEAARVVATLMRNKKQIHILSGDSRESVEKLGISLGVPQQCLHPEHSAFMKMEWIKKMQENIESDNGIGVIMVGDGLNDIPCLQESSIGISINAKSELNINASDIIMLSENLIKIVVLVKLVNRGNQFISINLFWAFLYNLTIMPIVAGLFYSYDLTVSPVWSSIAMSCSSVLVVAFSHFLSCFSYDEGLANERRNGYVKKLPDESELYSTKDMHASKQYNVLSEERNA